MGVTALLTRYLGGAVREDENVVWVEPWNALVKEYSRQGRSKHGKGEEGSSLILLFRDRE